MKNMNGSTLRNREGMKVEYLVRQNVLVFGARTYAANEDGLESLSKSLLDYVPAGASPEEAAKIFDEMMS
jgi:hypothetical protein